mmetsp:Transcript_23392/g.35297  ORF Transcript_23392/g.35297 Transcript_23392/m.35297 type:complete len:119 (+) Transcript_23392:61-417(+)
MMSVVSGTSNSRVKDAVQLCLPIRRTPSMMNPPERNRKYDEMMEGISESWQLLQRELHKRADTPTSGTCLGDEQAEGSPRSTKKKHDCTHNLWIWNHFLRRKLCHQANPTSEAARKKH